MRVEPFLEQLAADALREALDVDAPPILRPTQDPKHGDYQINGVLPLAKRLQRKPRDLAEPVAEVLRRHGALAEVAVAGPGFVNLRLDEGWVGRTLASAHADRARDGVPPIAEPETIVIDFSSPNIAKQLHVGHLRTTIIGDALQRILRFVGHRVIADNHLGDWGTQFGLLIVGMRTLGDEDALRREPIVELERVYKLASARAKEDAAFAEEARAELAKLHRGDPGNRELWAHFVRISRASLDALYERLGVHFDEWLAESAYHDMLPGVVDTLLERGLAQEDEGAIVVWFRDIEGAPAKLRKAEDPYIVRKRDGAFLYSTTDLATLQYRKDKLRADRALYVVDSRQAGHFEQLFALSDLLGLGLEVEHIGFGLMLGAGGRALKTRDGDTVKLADLLDEAEERAQRKMVEELGLDPEVAAELAPAVGVGAVKYADLGQNRTSNYTFDWDKLVAFSGNAGPYLQYAHARCSSILRRGEVDPATIDVDALDVGTPAEATLGRRLLRFPDVVHQAAEQRYPHFIGEHLYALSRDFSSFFEQCPVLKAEGETRSSRLAFVDLTRRQLRRGLDLLGIAAPPRM
ncbi:MAG: arginine--tRNA ligase [Sandaracinaceae bacterium]